MRVEWEGFLEEEAEADGRDDFYGLRQSLNTALSSSPAGRPSVRRNQDEATSQGSGMKQRGRIRGRASCEQ